MQKYNKNFDKARQQVKKARNCIYPNDGFIHHLKYYQKILQKREQQRLRKLQEQKRLAIDGSIVKSARKSIRGAVKGADLSIQKVKQMGQQRKKIVHQIIEESEVTQSMKQNQIKLSTKKLSKSRQSKDKNLSLNKNNKNNQTNLKQTNKINQVKQNNSSMVKQNTQKKTQKQIIFALQKQKSAKRHKTNEVKFRIQKKQDVLKVNISKQSKNQKNKQQMIVKNDKKIQIKSKQEGIKKSIQKLNHESKKKQLEFSSEINLKSVENFQSKSESTARKSLISAGQQSLAKDLILNQHDKKMKKIYQTKINVL